MSELHGLHLDLSWNHHLDSLLCSRLVRSPLAAAGLCTDVAHGFCLTRNHYTDLLRYTAVILLAYDRWTNDTLEKSSLINFSVARIIFSVCIFFSFILLVFDWYFAIRVIKGDGVADAYMNVIAVRYNCIRGGKGTGDSGWKRYLVFSRLTKSRGLVDYLALFTYFAFKGGNISASVYYCHANDT